MAALIKFSPYAPQVFDGEFQKNRIGLLRYKSAALGAGACIAVGDIDQTPVAAHWYTRADAVSPISERLIAQDKIVVFIKEPGAEDNQIDVFCRCRIALVLVSHR